MTPHLCVTLGRLPGGLTNDRDIRTVNQNEFQNAISPVLVFRTAIWVFTLRFFHTKFTLFREIRIWLENLGTQKFWKGKSNDTKKIEHLSKFLFVTGRPCLRHPTPAKKE